MACKNGNCCRKVAPVYEPTKEDLAAAEAAWAEYNAKSDFDADERHQIEGLVASRPLKACSIAVLLFTAAVVAFELALVFLSA